MTLCFTCREGKTWSDIKKSQNIMTAIVVTKMRINSPLNLEILLTTCIDVVSKLEQNISPGMHSLF